MKLSTVGWAILDTETGVIINRNSSTGVVPAVWAEDDGSAEGFLDEAYNWEGKNDDGRLRVAKVAFEVLEVKEAPKIEETKP